MKDFLGDNPVLRINGISAERLKAVFNLVEGFPAAGYFEDNGVLVFTKHKGHSKAINLISPVSAETCALLAMEWLKSQTYPPQPDHDGENQKGWLVWNDDWGRISGHDYHTFIAIKPQWIMYGK